MRRIGRASIDNQHAAIGKLDDEIIAQHFNFLQIDIRGQGHDIAGLDHDVDGVETGFARVLISRNRADRAWGGVGGERRRRSASLGDLDPHAPWCGA